MTTGDSSDDVSMFDLFRAETEAQARILADGLLLLEKEPEHAGQLEACMRAAHSLKGAARIVGVDAGVRVAHAMEDCLVAAQRRRIRLNRRRIDVLLRGVDLLTRIARTPEGEGARWTTTDAPEIDAFLAALESVDDSAESPGVAAPSHRAALPAPVPPASAAPVPSRPQPAQEAPSVAEVDEDRVLRVTAQHLNRLIGLAGESLVESRRLKPFSESLLRLKRLHQELERTVSSCRAALPESDEAAAAHAAFADVQNRAFECQQQIAARLIEIDSFDRRSASLSHRLYDQALAVRMRPLADAIQRLPRMVRDLGHSFGRQVRLEVTGEATPVDRDILDRIEAPLSHLLRNAVDHGIEDPDERVTAGKPAEGVIRLEARHSGGMLHVTVSDDGRGIQPERLREAVVEKKLTTSETARDLSEAELLEFLFLPGFSMKSDVTEISGRGVGLDAVQNMVRSVRGSVRVTSTPGSGTRFQLQLPLTLSVVRTLLVEISGEAYALPLAGVRRALRLPREKIEQLEGRPHFNFDGRPAGLVSAQLVLGREESPSDAADLCVVTIGDASAVHGLIVDRFLGERELVVQPLDPRLGKIQDVSAGALMEDGSPVLILDIDDVLRSVEKLAAAGRIGGVRRTAAGARDRAAKRVLVVDDSLTVRELERKLLAGRGYSVEIAVDGMDGWNAVRTGHFSLVVTDVDMPRLDGVELVKLIRKDANLKALPVMIVSYKDREEDRRRGLEAGADYYLTKGSFHDETLIQAVVDLIGEPA